MKRAVCVLIALGVLLGVMSSLTADVSRGQIEDAIDAGVTFLVSRQADDGRWPYYVSGVEDTRQYPVGHTSLALLALQHSGSKRTDVHLAIKKGLSYILQRPSEAMTYTAGLVTQVLYADNARQNHKMISAYGWMLCSGQNPDGLQTGSWTYRLVEVRENWKTHGLGQFGALPDRHSDNSNSQFGILGLVYAEKAGFQVPRIVWERASKYYRDAQYPDGGWDYLSEGRRKEIPTTDPVRETLSMTLAGTVSSYLCEEALADKRHRQCKTPAPNLTHEAGLKWIAEHWRSSQSPYGWYATERLGILIGYSEFGGHDWYQEGAPECISVIRNAPGVAAKARFGVVDPAFSVLFLARGRHPIIINKLKRDGDWNLHRYDLKNLIEHVSGPWQRPSQWRIVSLDASVDFLLKVPILWISGHDALNLNAEEKAKLKEYVERGGTILGEACCGRAAFDLSFRELLKELWPETELRDLPKTHAIYTSFRKLTQKPALMGLPLEKGQGRLGVIYVPHGMSCKWEVSGPRSRPWLDVGACIYLYVDQTNRRMGVATRAAEEE